MLVLLPPSETKRPGGRRIPLDLDPIPDHRLGAVARLPGLPTLSSVSVTAVSVALAERSSSFVLDLRSEAYVRLGPILATIPSAYVRVVRTEKDGTARALNHLDKSAKDALVRTLASSGPASARCVGSYAGPTRSASR